MSNDTSKYMITRLNATNYFNWRFRLEMLLKEKGVWKTIDDERPTTPNDEWIKSDEKALSTISLLVDDDQIQHIRGSKSAKEAWQQLKDFHEENTPASISRILRLIMRQRADENTDMEAHVNRMHELFQQLLAFGEEIKPEVLLNATLLASLPISYDPMVTALDKNNKELSSSIVRSTIIEEYRRRKEREVTNQIDSSALKITHFGGNRKLITCYFCKQKGHHRNKY